jgi:hypothetical protein
MLARILATYVQIGALERAAPKRIEFAPCHLPLFPQSIYPSFHNLCKKRGQ